MDLADPHLDTALDTTATLCPGCGHQHTTDDARRLAWSSEHAPDGSVTFICPDCTRADIGQIEAGLPCLGRRSPAA